MQTDFHVPLFAIRVGTDLEKKVKKFRDCVESNRAGIFSTLRIAEIRLSSEF